jgi:hypothetical protein
VFLLCSMFIVTIVLECKDCKHRRRGEVCTTSEVNKYVWSYLIRRVLTSGPFLTRLMWRGWEVCMQDTSTLKSMFVWSKRFERVRIRLFGRPSVWEGYIYPPTHRQFHQYEGKSCGSTLMNVIPTKGLWLVVNFDHFDACCYISVNFYGCWAGTCGPAWVSVQLGRIQCLSGTSSMPNWA